MKYAHTITVTEFAQEDENLTELRDTLKTLIPFCLDQEKLAIRQETAEGFNHKKIIMLTIPLTKERHITQFLKHFISHLTPEQKQLLISQQESRLDENLYFYIRITKKEWNQHKKILLTDNGNCIHIKIAMAAFPAQRAIAQTVVTRLFTLQ